jgi:hypothetical protein
VARAREAHVLGRLAATGKLTQAQAARAYRAPLHLVGGPARGCRPLMQQHALRGPPSPGSPRTREPGMTANAG